MPAEQAIVALHRGRGHLRLAQKTIEEAACSGARFAVHEADVRARDVLGFADAARIAGRDRKTPLQEGFAVAPGNPRRDRKSTRLNSSHVRISYAVFCLKKKKNQYLP